MFDDALFPTHWSAAQDNIKLFIKNVYPNSDPSLHGYPLMSHVYQVFKNLTFAVQHQQRATMRREGYTNIIEAAQGIECLTYKLWTTETKKIYELMLSIVTVCKTVFNFSPKWVYLFFMILTFLKSLNQQYFVIDLHIDRYCYEPLPASCSLDWIWIFLSWWDHINSKTTEARWSVEWSSWQGVCLLIKQ